MKNRGGGYPSERWHLSMEKRRDRLRVQETETAKEKDRSTQPPVFFYDGATPTEKSIAAWAAGGEQSANAASCEGAARSAAVLLAANFRNWGRIPAQRWDRKDTPATSVLARSIPD
jgi:hypothetical protein